MFSTKIMIPFYETSAIKYGTTGMNYVTWKNIKSSLKSKNTIKKLIYKNFQILLQVYY